MALDEPRLRAWAEDAAGGKVAAWEPLTSGNSRRSWALDVTASDSRRELVLRQDTGGGPVAGTELTLAREALAYRALQGRGLAIPGVLALHPSGEALLLERVAGTADDPAAALGDLLARLADLHRVPVGELDLPGAGESSIADVERWERIRAQRVGDAHPLAALAGRLLRDRHPGEPERTVLCHGDVGAGNFLHVGGRVTGLLDWEFWHVGDPHDDLAWIAVRATLFGEPLEGFAAGLRRCYAARAGVALDPRRLRYWQAVCLWRTLICCLAMVHRPEPGADRLLHVMLLPVLERQLVAALARLVDMRLEPAPPLGPPRELPGALELREIAAGLAHLVERVEQPDLRLAARRMRRLAAQLAETSSLAFDVAAADAAESADAADRGDLAAGLRRFGRAADRRLMLFPGSRPLAEAPVIGLEDDG